MAEIISLTRLPWADGSSILSSPVRVVWADGTALYSTGGTYTAPSPPAGGTPAVPNLTARTAIAAASSYNLVSTCTVIDLRDGQPVPVDSVSFNTDEDALFWALSLAGGQALYDKLKAGVQPATVAVTLNGEEWRFVIEDVPRQRRHGEATVRASGRSLTCLAGAPYEFEQNWSLAGDTTALQLAAAANVNTGLAIEWGLIDWPIPDGVFSHAGTPLSVVKRVADAVGAMIQSDPKDFTVRVVPRYDLLPNEWPTVAPDAQLAEAALESEGYENTNKPAYDGVYVLGQQGGAAAFVRLAGTSGANLKPMVTDALLTDLVACQQRGMAELGRSGEQQRHTLTLPVYSGTGEPHVLRVGKIVKVMEPTPWWGMVRSVAVQAQFGEASQTVTVERHTRLVDGTYYDPNAPTPLRLVGSVPAQIMTAGSSFLLDLSAYFADGVTPYAYSMRSGTLPAWMTLDGGTGHITGTVPSSMTPVNLRFRCTDDASSTADTNEVAFSLGSAGALYLMGSGNKFATAPSVGGTFTQYTSGNWTAPRQLIYDGTTAVANIIRSSTYELIYSTDGGATWTDSSVFSASTYDSVVPNYLVRTSSEWVALFVTNGVGGTSHYASSDGVTWSQRTITLPSWIGLLVSVAAIEGAIYAMCVDYFGASYPDEETTIYRSADGGLNWTSVLNEVSTPSFKPEVYLKGGGKYLLIDGYDARVSTTGVGSWSVVSLPAFVQCGLWDGSRFVVVTGGAYAVGTSSDGSTWSFAGGPTLPGSGNVMVGFLFDGANYIISYRDSSGANAGGFLYSADLATWTDVPLTTIAPRCTVLV